MALLLKTTGGIEEIRPATGRTFVLDELQALVGGFIEVVRACDGKWLVLNEDGKRHGLPTNWGATLVFNAARLDDWCDGAEVAPHMAGEVLVGDVLLADAVEMGEEV